MDISAPKIVTEISAYDCDDATEEALDAWADEEDIYLYGWQNIEILDEARVKVSRIYYGCGYSDVDEDIYTPSKPPPIPQPGLVSDDNTA